MTTHASMSLSSVLGVFMSRKSGSDEWQRLTTEGLLKLCERGGPVERLLEEHQLMHEFLCREANIGRDKEGYADWFDRFRRDATVRRIDEFLASIEEVGKRDTDSHPGGEP